MFRTIWWGKHGFLRNTKEVVGGEEGKELKGVVEYQGLLFYVFKTVGQLNLY